jgi:hypothetical protein
MCGSMLDGTIRLNRFPWLDDVRFGCMLAGLAEFIQSTAPTGKSWQGWVGRTSISSLTMTPRPECRSCNRQIFPLPNIRHHVDRSFPLGFDFANPFPAAKFSEEGRYLGEPFRNYLRPCTWATDIVTVATMKCLSSGMSSQNNGLGSKTKDGSSTSPDPVQI